ncbi:MAG TPA: hypothetical protein VD839_05275 [Burkholderiales bacterium]|jgi:hypothetical protein|nr:hypothetical protein [Burkholderiales bacterium]
MKKIGAAILGEIREAVPATIFFLWLFHMIALTKAVSLGDYSFTALRATVATVGALIVAKAILVVEALPISRIFKRNLWFHVLWKTLLFNVVVLIFRFIEEIIHLTRKYGDLSTAVARLSEEIVWPQFAVFQLWLFFGLFLYCVIAEIVRLVGMDKVKAAFYASAGKASHG